MRGARAGATEKGGEKHRIGLLRAMIEAPVSTWLDDARVGLRVSGRTAVAAPGGAALACRTKTIFLTPAAMHASLRASDILGRKERGEVGEEGVGISGAAPALCFHARRFGVSHRGLQKRVRTRRAETRGRTAIGAHLTDGA